MKIKKIPAGGLPASAVIPKFHPAASLAQFATCSPRNSPLGSGAKWQQRLEAQQKHDVNRTGLCAVLLVPKVKRLAQLGVVFPGNWHWKCSPLGLVPAAVSRNKGQNELPVPAARRVCLHACASPSKLLQARGVWQRGAGGQEIRA